MKLDRSRLAALAALISFTPRSTGAASFQEDFASDPALHNWQVAGDPGLYRWNSTNHNLEVTWDSSHTNSYFCHPLGTSVSHNDDFTLQFELRLTDFVAGPNPQMPNPFQLAVALINLTNATHSGFHRGSGYESPNLVEFSFFPDPGGNWQWGPSLTAVMVDHTGFNWSSGGFSVTFDGDKLISDAVYKTTEAEEILALLEHAQCEQALHELKFDVDVQGVKSESLGGSLSFTLNGDEKPLRHSERALAILRPYLRARTVARFG